MITKVKGKKFDGDLITLRGGNKIGIKETTQELLDRKLSEKEICMIKDSFGPYGVNPNLNDEIQEILEAITDVGWNDEKYRPQSKGYQGKDMYPRYVMKCLIQGYQDYETMKEFGLVK